MVNFKAMEEKSMQIMKRIHLVVAIISSLSLRTSKLEVPSLFIPVQAFVLFFLMSYACWPIHDEWDIEQYEYLS